MSSKAGGRQKPKKKRKARVLAMRIGAAALAAGLCVLPLFALVSVGIQHGPLPELLEEMAEALHLPELAGVLDVPVEAFTPEPVQTPVPPPPPPPQKSLSVETLYQYPELPNGCEVTSLAIVLNYWGYEVDKVTLAEEYLPTLATEWDEEGLVGGDPEAVYPGNPADSSGFYCYPPVIVQAAERYLARAGGGDGAGAAPALEAADITGAQEEDLLRYIADGSPVILWCTTDLLPPTTREGLVWRVVGGAPGSGVNGNEMYEPYVNMHA